MTEEQLMARRALQEALDRRDNGGPPPEALRRSEISDSSAWSVPGESHPSTPATERAGAKEPAAPAPGSVVADQSGDESEPTAQPPTQAFAEVDEPRLGVPFPRVAA